MPARFLATLWLCLLLSSGLPLRAQEPSAAGFTLRTVVIDAGHGGHDPGCVFGKTREKDITLDIAVRLGEKIKKAYPEVKVIYTRERDIYIPLVQRGRKANRNHADLFISIHVNSARNASAHGTETFLMGTDKSRSNMEVCKRENSVILLEDDYSTQYAGYDPNEPDSFIFFNMMQNAQFEQSVMMAELVEQQLSQGPVGFSRGIKQAPLLVLWRTTMPAVLVEVGFLSNAKDRAQLTDRDARGKTADCIFRAFAAFKKEFDRGIERAKEPEAPADSTVAPGPDSTVKTAAPTEPVTRPSDIAPTDTVYRIQIFSLSRKLSDDAPEFQGEKADCLTVGETYKYCIGFYKTRFEAAAALSRLKSKFSGAFLVRVSPDGAIVR